MSSPLTTNIRFPQFAAAVASTMRAKRITGRAVAAALDVRESTVSEWKTGLYRPDGDRLTALAGVLGVPVHELLGDDAPDVPVAPRTETFPVNTDPVAALVAHAQGEASAWLLEFAARVLEAGADRLRQGMPAVRQRRDILDAVDETEAVLAARAATPPASTRPPASAPPAPHPTTD